MSIDAASKLWLLNQYDHVCKSIDRCRKRAGHTQQELDDLQHKKQILLWIMANIKEAL